MIYAPELMDLVYIPLLELTSALAVDGLDIALGAAAALTIGFSIYISERIWLVFRELLAVFEGELTGFATKDFLGFLSLSIID